MVRLTQTFATLEEHVAATAPRLRSSLHRTTFGIEGREVELTRISVGGAEWAVISVRIDVPRRSMGLGAIVRSLDGWALRLTLPVAEVTFATFSESMLRLAREATLYTASSKGPSATFSHFAD